MRGLVKVLVAVVGLIVGLGLLAAVIWLPPLFVDTSGIGGPSAVQDRLKAVNDLRGTLVTVLGGIAVASGAIVAYLNLRQGRLALRETERQNRATVDLTRQTLELTRRGQVTERFTKAIDQLGQTGADKLDIRLGGIYALEQIARDSPDLHGPVVEILTAWLRVHSESHIVVRARARAKEIESSRGESQTEPATEVDNEEALRTTPSKESTKWTEANTLSDSMRELLEIQRRADLHGVGIVLGRRNTAHDQQQLNLSGVDLRDASLKGARLDQANLRSAMLREADLRGAQLAGADLRDADLMYARLGGANMSGAKLDLANLQWADLAGADVDGGGDALGLTGEQLMQALSLKEARLPSYLPGNVTGQFDELITQLRARKGSENAEQ